MSKNNRCKQNSCKKEKENVLISFVRYGSIIKEAWIYGGKYRILGNTSKKFVKI